MVLSKIRKLLGIQDRSESVTRRADNEPRVELPMSHDGRKLVIRNILAAPAIEVGGDTIEIVAKGKPSRLNELMFAESNGVVTLSGPQNAANYVMVEFSGAAARLGKKIFRRTNVQVLTKSDVIDLKVRVPEGTELEIKNVDGDITVGDTKARLKLDVPFNHQAVVGAVHDAEMKADSSARIMARGVTGKLAINAGFNSQVEVTDAEVTNLKVRCDSNAQASVGGSICDADTHAGFNSTVKLGHVTGRLSLRTDSSAVILAENGSVTEFFARAKFNSTVKFKGVADSADIGLESSAHATVGRVTESLVLRAGFNSRLKVGGGNPDGSIPRVSITTDSSTEVEISAGILGGQISAGFNSRIRAREYAPEVRIRKSSAAEITTF